MDEIREVIETKAALLRKGDIQAILSYYAPSYVEYTLAPPLQQPGDGRDPAPLAAWFATFEAPPSREVTRLEITTDGDVAFATSLDCLTAVPRGATESFTLWFRVTLGLRRIDGRWLVTHEHESVPFEMDGSFRASIGLTP
ncbi:ketosteroid isomerase-like protein [Actinoplanes tereljensis]|uniref:Ketosteroid isomerase n=1 Tax=Paractinoplanes tereljensis TaxID=571912 RepID=A0A919NH86_9ACTN|nr:nuclear transport factor 2 family protein [Actinoplanes tereljensis]GIF18074.1 ketosteroid isomerase [Actinoplanes tereljensis]